MLGLDARAGRDDLPAARRALQPARHRRRHRRLPPLAADAEVGVGLGGLPPAVPRVDGPGRRRRVPAAVAARSRGRCSSACARSENDLARLEAGERHPGSAAAAPRPHALRPRVPRRPRAPRRATCTCSSTRCCNGVRQVAEAVAAAVLPQRAGARLPLPRPYGSGRRSADHVDDALRHPLPHDAFTTTTSSASSQNELRACPASDDHQQLVAYRVTTQPGVAGPLLHRLLGHPGRHVRRPRAPRRRSRSSPRPRSRRCRAPLVTVVAPGGRPRRPGFRDHHVEYLEPIDAHRVGRRRVGGRRAHRGRHRAPTSWASCWRCTGSCTRSPAATRPAPPTSAST